MSINLIRLWIFIGFYQADFNIAIFNDKASIWNDNFDIAFLCNNSEVDVAEAPKLKMFRRNWKGIYIFLQCGEVYTNLVIKVTRSNDYVSG